MMAQMSIAPFEAQKRAQNLGLAESAAVTYAASNEGLDTFSDVPSDCDLSNPSDGAYTISCTVGAGTKYTQTVSRTFRSAVDSGVLGYTGEENIRVFRNPVPGKISYVHQCPPGDEWGLNWFNATHGETLGACTPQDAWNKSRYLASDPDSWLYDINNFNGYGQHPDYDNVGSTCQDDDHDNGHGNSGGYDCSNPGRS